MQDNSSQRIVAIAFSNDGDRTVEGLKTGPTFEDAVQRLIAEVNENTAECRAENAKAFGADDPCARPFVRADLVEVEPNTLWSLGDDLVVEAYTE